MLDRIERIKQNITRISELIILLCISVNVFLWHMELTTFNLPIDYGKILKAFYLVLAVAVAVKACIGLKDKYIWFSLPVAIVFYFAWPPGNYGYQAYVALLIVGCVGMSVTKIIAAVFVPSVLVTANMMFASLCGSINSMALVGRNIRSYWGHIHPTDFGTAVFVIVLFAWIVFIDFPDEVFILPALFSLFISSYVARSDTSKYLTILFILVLLYRSFERRVIEGKGRFKWIKAVVNFLMRITFPVLGLAVLALVYAYHKDIPIARVIDTYLHQSLVIASNMYERFGLKPFGTFFDMIGAGGSPITINEEYTFVDSSYPQILIRYGYITCIAANILWVYTTDKAIKKNNRRLAAAMTVMAVDFVMEHHYYELDFNPFKILPFAELAPIGICMPRSMAKLCGRERFREKRYKAVYIITSVICVALIILFMPTVFSWLRTVFNGHGMSGGGHGGVKVFVILTAILGMTIIMVHSLSATAADLINKKKPLPVHLLMICAGILFYAALVSRTDIMIDQAGGFISDRIAKEREIIEQIKNAKTGKLYVDRLPEVYARDIGGIDRSYMCGEDFARSNNATVIVDVWNDSQCFQKRGFLYLPISEYDAIYTNDKDVIAALKEDGRILKGYNDHINSANMWDMAGWNGLGMEEDGSIILHGEGQRIICGPYVDLYSGKFTARFRLSISEDISKDVTNQNLPVCRLQISSYWGQKEISEKVLMAGDFDKSGSCEYELPYNGGGRAYEYKVIPIGDVTVRVSGIDYYRTPDYDVHTQIDEKGRQIHVEFYDTEGIPCEQKDGYCGIEFEYDRKDNATRIRYLGSDMEPVIIGEGYAEIRREYDKNKQILSEYYYDEAGKSIALSGGQAGWKRIYDFDGNVTDQRFYGANGENVLFDGKYWRVIREFNDDRKCIREEYRDTQDRPVNIPDGYAVSETEYDADGHITAKRYYNMAYDLTVVKPGYASYKRQYDGLGRVIREEYYGILDKPIALSGGQAAYEREYDDADNPIVTRYYGINGERILYNGQYWRINCVYNEKKQVIKEEYYGPNYRRICVKGGYAGLERGYDSKRNVVKMTYLGRDGKPAYNEWGYVIWHLAYNDKKQIVREEYYDENDEKLTLKSGQQAVEYEYDDAGNRNTDRYYDANNVPILLNGKFHCVKRTYNDKKQNIHEDYFGTDMMPISINDGYTSMDLEYDADGKLVKKTFRDLDNVVVNEESL